MHSVGMQLTHIVLSDTCVHQHPHSTHVHSHTRAWEQCLTWLSSLEPCRNLTHVSPSVHPEAGLHSALLALTWTDTAAAHRASRGSCQEPTTIAAAANWLCVGPRVTARSAMADTFFPHVSGKALLSPPLRPQPATEPHMPGHMGLAEPVSIYPSPQLPRCPHHTPCSESTRRAYQTGQTSGRVAVQGTWGDHWEMRTGPGSDICV